MWKLSYDIDENDDDDDEDYSKNASANSNNSFFSGWRFSLITSILRVSQKCF